MYCPYCGSQIDAGVKFCPNCGANLQEEAKQDYSEPVVQEDTYVPNNQYYDDVQNDYQPGNNYPASDDKVSIPFALIGFLLPIAGIILFFVWRQTRPQRAKGCLYGACAGMLCNILAMFARSM